MILNFKKLHPDAILPTYKTKGAAGMDVCSVENSFILCHERGVVLVGTGLAVEVPEGFELQVRPRSGLTMLGLAIANSPGTIDADYRGEIRIMLLNHYATPIEIRKGDRIAQLVLAKVERADCMFVPELDETERGSNGFGSTGVQ